MKHFFAILAIVLMMVEVCLTGFWGRSKRDDNEPLLVLHQFKRFAEDIQNIMRAVIKEMSSSDAYNEYKLELETLLEDIHQMTGLLCWEKTIENINAFVEIIKKYQNDVGPAEAKEIMRMFWRHGFKELREKYTPGFQKVKLENFIDNINKLDKSKDKYWEFIELC